ncbi:MAG: hypothetical protein Kapaf2KO_17490 [Candidatus Kapaibacteriales bacterium]
MQKASNKYSNKLIQPGSPIYGNPKEIIYLLFIILTFLLLTANAKGEPADQEFEAKTENADIPSVYGQTSWGVEFFLTAPPNDGFASDQNSIFLEITSLVENRANLSIGYFNWTASTPIPAGTTIRYPIPVEAMQAFNKTLEDPIPVGNGIYRDRALRVTSESPVTISVTSQFGDKSDSYLALPLHVLGLNYAVTPYQTSESYYDFSDNMPAYAIVVATEDNTTVEYHQNGIASSRTNAGTKTGEKTLKTLYKGDIWVISTSAEDSDIAGSWIVANRPVSVFSGNQCTNVPIYNDFCDFMMNMELPMVSWGKQYLSLASNGRSYNNINRVFSKEDNTDIYVGGTFQGRINEANPDYPRRAFELSRNLSSADPIYIHSDKPIYAVEYTTGSDEENKPVTGGPSMQSLMKISDNISEAYFNIDKSVPGNSFPKEDFLRIVYRKVENDSLGFSIESNDGKKIDLSDNSIISGKGDIQGTDLSYIIIKFRSEGTYKVFGEGVASIQKTGTIGKTSYAQPIYLTIQNEEKARDTLPPKLFYTRNCDGSISGYAEDMPRDNDVRSKIGLNLVNDIENFIFLPDNQNNVNIKRWSLTPIDATKPAYAILTFWDRRGNGETFRVDYSPPKIEASEKNISFGTVEYGSKITKRTNILNFNSESAFEFEKIYLANGEHFKISEIRERPLVSSNISPNGIRELQIEYNPQTTGIHKDTILIDRGCGNLELVYISADSRQSEIWVQDRQLGDLPQGNKNFFDIRIENRGGIPFILNTAKFTKGDIFELVDSKIPDGTDGWLIEPAKDMFLNLRVRAQVPGKYTDTLIIGSEAKNGDSLGIISVWIKEPGLIARSYDYGRKRLDIGMSAGNGYKADENSLILENRADFDIKIDRAIITGNAFYLTNSLKDLTIKSGDTIDIPLEFIPNSLGAHEGSLTIIDEFGNSTLANVSGFGACAQVVAEDIMGVKAVSGDTIKGYWTVRNKSLSEWEYAYPVTINSIQEMGIPSNRFIFDYSQILPLTLEPGEAYSFEYQFQPLKTQASEENFEANIEVLSDACESNSFVYQAEVLDFSTEIELSQLFIETCANQRKGTQVTFTNISTVEVSYTDITLKGDKINFDLNPVLLKSFTLLPGESRTIEVGLFSETKGNYTTTLSLIENDKNEITQNISGTVSSFERELLISGIDESAVSNDLNFSVLETATISVRISDVNEDVTSIGNATFRLSYDDGTMQPIETSVAISEVLKLSGFEIEQIDFQDDFIDITISSANGMLPNSSTEIFSISFDLFVPELGSEGKLNAKILTDAGCMYIKDADKTLMLTDCDVYHRSVTSAGESEINLSVQNDNVIISGKAGHPSILSYELASVSGKTIDLLSDRPIEVGNFEHSVPLTGLANGIYIIRIKGLGKNLTEKILIQK